jgi:hypothetical protein
VASRDHDGAGAGSFADELAGLITELEAWDEEFFGGLGRDALGATLAAFEAVGEEDNASEGAGAAGASIPGALPARPPAPGSVEDAIRAGGLLASARLLATTAVQSLLADRCDVVRGPCPDCGRTVALKGCGQAPEFAPSLGDVAALKRYERALEAQDLTVALDAGPERGPRPVRETASRAARLLEELGGLDRLRALFATRKPEGSTS